MNKDLVSNLLEIMLSDISHDEELSYVNFLLERNSLPILTSS